MDYITLKHDVVELDRQTNDWKRKMELLQVCFVFKSLRACPCESAFESTHGLYENAYLAIDSSSTTSCAPFPDLCCLHFLLCVSDGEESHASTVEKHEHHVLGCLRYGQLDEAGISD